MISQETTVMEDEDSWCAFIENEYISDEMKWNIGPMFGSKWQVKRIAPMNLTEFDRNLRFQSALRRTLKTFSRRQIEITSEIFAWHDKCIHKGFLQLEVKQFFSAYCLMFDFSFNSLNCRLQKKRKPTFTNTGICGIKSNILHLFNSTDYIILKIFVSSG